MAHSVTKANGRRPLHILLVEDETDDQLLFLISVRAAGLDLVVQRVSTAQQARDYLQGVPPFADRQANPLPDALVVDLFLPGTSSLELIRWLRAAPAFKHLPVAVYSGALDADLRAMLDALGGETFFTKPSRQQGWALMVREIYNFARRHADGSASDSERK